MLQPWRPALVAACGEGAGGICSRGPNWGSPLPGGHMEEMGSGFAVSERGSVWMVVPGRQTLLCQPWGSGSKQSISRHWWRRKTKREWLESSLWKLPAAPACPGLLTRVPRWDPLLSHAPRASLAPVQAKLLEIILSWKCLQEMVGNGGSRRL